MKKLFGAAALVISSLLTACGGGGGSPGATPNLPYTITLTADKTQLPINLTNQVAGIGAYAPYTAALYVNAFQGGAPIPGGTGIFGCNVSQGLVSGSLYYLDGNAAHEDANLNPLAYRSIVLDSNSGGNSFHFNAGTSAGTATITCSVNDPTDKQVYSASVNIVVGANTGKPASVIATAQAPGYLGASNNTTNLRNNVVISAQIMDDANQPIPAPAAPNLQVSIRSFGASAGARLISGSQSGTTVQLNTIGGVAQFSLSSGPSTGVILLELTTDRSDNNVSNGIQDPVTQLMAVSVQNAAPGAVALTIKDAAISVANGMPYSYALTAQGGVPPYQWSSSALPSGLTLSSDGVISGTPTAKDGAYNVTLTVQDEAGKQASTNLTITVSGAFAIDGCSSDVSTPCTLPAGKVGIVYSDTLSFSIGDPSVPVVWTVTGSLPAGLALAANGTISGTPSAAGSYIFIVTATRGSLTVSNRVTIVVS